MTLKSIVQTLGGDLYDRGRRANIPAPGHSAADRSVSLLLEGGRVVVHTFGGADWREVLDHLRGRGLIDARHALLSVNGAAAAVMGNEAPSAQARRAAAARIWEAGAALGHSLAARHCRLRGLIGDLPGPDALRYGSGTPVSVYRDGGPVRPALLAGIRAADGALTAVEVTYLAPNARRALDLRLPRKTVGVAPGGCAVRLDPAAPSMLVAEGVFTARSAGEWFGLPAWALMSTRNLRVWRAPEGVRSVLIAADRGADGEASAEQLRRGLVDQGVAATLALPPEPFGDWNEWSGAVGPRLVGTQRTKEGSERVRPGAG
jgi:hypothetical protein